MVSLGPDIFLQLCGRYAEIFFYVLVSSKLDGDRRDGKTTLEMLEYTSRIGRILTNHFSKHHFKEYQEILHRIGEIKDKQSTDLFYSLPRTKVDQSCDFCSAKATYQNFLSIANSKQPMYKYNR